MTGRGQVLNSVQRGNAFEAKLDTRSHAIYAHCNGHKIPCNVCSGANLKKVAANQREGRGARHKRLKSLHCYVCSPDYCPLRWAPSSNPRSAPQCVHRSKERRRCRSQEAAANLQEGLRTRRKRLESHRSCTHQRKGAHADQMNGSQPNGRLWDET